MTIKKKTLKKVAKMLSRGTNYTCKFKKFEDKSSYWLEIKSIKDNQEIVIEIDTKGKLDAYRVKYKLVDTLHEKLI